MAIPSRPTFTSNPLATDELVQYDHLDKTRDYYAALWADDYTTSAFADTSNTDHRYGWGQPAVTIGTAAQFAIVEAAHINELIAQVNAGERHQDASGTTNLLPFYQSVDIINQLHLNGLLTNIDDMIVNKYDLGSDNTINATEENINSNTQTPAITTWSDGLHCEVVYTFTNYQQARYFFNTGGELLLDLSSDATSWHQVFDAMGTISVKAEETTNAPTLEHENYDPSTKEYTAQAGSAGAGLTGLSGGGFYDMNNTYVGDTSNISGTYKLLFTAQGNYGMYDSAYTFYSGYGMYSSRQVKLWGYCKDDAPVGFKVYLRVELVEDVDDGVMGGTFEADWGYKQAAQSPNTTDLGSSIANFVTVGSTVYKFDPTLYTWDENLPIDITAYWTATDISGKGPSTAYVLRGPSTAPEGEQFSVQLQTDVIASGTNVTFEITGVQSPADYNLSGVTTFNTATGIGTFIVGSEDTLRIEPIANDGAENETMTISTSGVSPAATLAVTITDA